MRVVLDECLPRGLRRHLPGHVVQSVQEIGGTSVKNGALLRLLAGSCDAFLTVDRNMRYQQLRGHPFGVVVVRARSNDITTLMPLVPGIEDALARIQPGQLLEVGDWRPRARDDDPAP